MTINLPPVPQIDYTSRDYQAIRDDMVGLIDNFAPQWTSRDSSDFGIVMIELFSYMGDLLNYYIDRAANEAFLSSATQRETVINIARLLNYTPTNVLAASGTIQFFNNTLSTKTIPAGTRVATEPDQDGNRVTFETQTAVTNLASGATSSSVAILQGISVKQEQVGISNGNASQIFKISKVPVIQDSVVVTVAYRTYNVTQHLVDYAATDEVCSLITDGAGYTYIVFGNGVSGKIPPIGTTIYCTYRYGGGALGNLGADSITTVVSDGFYGIEIAQDNPTTGGADAESTDSIRLNAPSSLRSINRAVSLLDYAQIATQVTGVAKAIAASDVFTSVNLYVACFDGVPLSSQSGLSQTILDYFQDKTPPNTTLTVNDFTPIYPVIHVEVTTRAGYDSTEVKEKVKAALFNLLAFDNVSFNETISQEDILNAAGTYSISGVQFLKITRMENQNTTTNPTSADGTVTSATKLTYNINEIPIPLTNDNFILVKDPT
jgi:hypothetical protein